MTIALESPTSAKGLKKTQGQVNNNRSGLSGPLD
jgi:hypothetical protein